MLVGGDPIFRFSALMRVLNMARKSLIFNFLYMLAIEEIYFFYSKSYQNIYFTVYSITLKNQNSTKLPGNFARLNFS
jgi:hypothetical protein